MDMFVYGEGEFKFFYSIRFLLDMEVRCRGRGGGFFAFFFSRVLYAS